jgi:hypothetical protein
MTQEPLQSAGDRDAYFYWDAYRFLRGMSLLSLFRGFQAQVLFCPELRDTGVNLKLESHVSLWSVQYTSKTFSILSVCRDPLPCSTLFRAEPQFHTFLLSEQSHTSYIVFECAISAEVVVQVINNLTNPA